MFKPQMYRRQRYPTTTAAIHEAVKLIEINKEPTPARSAKIKPRKRKTDSDPL